MTSGLEKIIANVLTALYQPFWFSILLSIMAMFFISILQILKMLEKDLRNR